MPYIAGRSLGSSQETAGITEGEMLLPPGEYLFSRKQIVISMILSGHCRVNSNWSLFMNSILSPCFIGIVTLHSVLDCAVNSALLAALQMRVLF